MTAGLDLDRVYISGPLQAAADLDAARAFYEELADICRAAGLDPYLPHTQTDPQQHADTPPQAVFERDMAAQLRCGIVLAEIGAPSSGVGAELAFAYEHRQPVIGIWSAESRPSRFILGMLHAHPAARLLTYRDLDDLRAQLTEALASSSEPGPSRAWTPEIRLRRNSHRTVPH